MRKTVKTELLMILSVTGFVIMKTDGLFRQFTFFKKK